MKFVLGSNTKNSIFTRRFYIKVNGYISCITDAQAHYIFIVIFIRIISECELSSDIGVDLYVVIRNILVARGSVVD